MSEPSPLHGVQHNARLRRDAGDLAGARAMLAEALEAAKPAYGEGHPDLLSTAHLLARMHREAAEPAAARRVLEEALAAGQRRVGDSDPLLLAISFDLGWVADELGNRHEARRNFGRVAGAGSAVLGHDHWAVRAAREYLGDEPPVGAGEPADPDPAGQTWPGMRVSGEFPGGPAIGGPEPMPPIDGPATRPPIGQPPSGQPTTRLPTGQPATRPPSAQPPSGQPATRPPSAQPPSGQPAIRLSSGQAAGGQPVTGSPAAGLTGPSSAQPGGPPDIGLPRRVDRGVAAPVVTGFRPDQGSDDGHGQPAHHRAAALPVARTVGFPQRLPAHPVPARSPQPARAPVSPPRRGRGPAIAAGVAAVAATVAAALAAVAVLRDGDPGPAGSTAGQTTGTVALTGDAPTDVAVARQGDTLVLTWRDPAPGRVSFVVTGAPPGATLRLLGQVPPGTTRFPLNGANAGAGYCFRVAAVYSTDEVGVSKTVCVDATAPSAPG